MQTFNSGFSQLVRRRYSCRTFSSREIETEKQDLIRNFISGLEGGAPFGNPIRFKLSSRKQLKTENPFTTGTYGMIKGTRAFIVGLIKNGAYKNFEDFGYCMEKAVMFVTDLGLDSCWIGGVFDRKTFGKIIEIKDNEILPAVIALGYGEGKRTIRDRLVRWGAKGDSRHPADRLFFNKDFQHPLRAPHQILENIGLAPSASNKQPWRIVVDDGDFHFYLYRDKLYSKLIPRVDLQRIDMGIAMCHFECSAAELGLTCQRTDQAPTIAGLPPACEYVTSYSLQQ
jgi:nitroreductase